jgi:hypothetical protein
VIGPSAPPCVLARVGGHRQDLTPSPARAGGSETTEEARMADDIEKGDHVSWKSHGSETEGTVKREITTETEAAGRKVKASKDEPQYEVESDKSGKSAVHKPEALHEK